MKKWILQSRLKFEKNEFEIDKLIEVLLNNRGIKTKKEIDEFSNPSLSSLTPRSLEISRKDLKKSIDRIKTAIKKKEQIIIFGDYDVDGVTGTAILWETLRNLGANVMPYIPHRTEEGYGLSVKGIENLKMEFPETSLIITVDNGIVANAAVEFANNLKIDVIITDHHVPGKKLPYAYSIVHSTKICGAAVGWFLSSQFKKENSEHLGLVALATVADLMQLKGFNRTLLKLGLEELRKTKRPGLIALFKLAGIEQEKIGVYELGHIIGPRINAMGRLEHAMDSLRLICTKDPKRAEELAKKLNTTNLERQQITLDSFLHAKNLVGGSKKKLLFVSHEIYEPGVIGLIAGKLSEEFYRPSIVVATGEIYSKASARSVSGFNIIEFIRLSGGLLVDAGGHPGAAGFTVETKNLKELQKLLEKLAEEKIDRELLTRTLRIDCELDLNLINMELFVSLNELSPFGYGNPEPTFLTKGATIVDMRLVGKNSDHLKLRIGNGSGVVFDSILFGYGSSNKLKIGDRIDIVYAISENEWNGNKKLELKLKDLARISL